MLKGLLYTKRTPFREKEFWKGVSFLQKGLILFFKMIPMVMHVEYQ